MMMKLLGHSLVVAVLLSGSALAEEGVEFAFEVFQYDSTEKKDVLLFSDTAMVLKNVTATGFLVAFSVEVQVTQADSNRAAFEMHLVTLGPPAHTYSRSFTAEYGLPAAIGSIIGKGSTQYSFVTIPLSPVDIDTSACSFNHREQGTFNFDPTAHMDIYYVPHSLGDYYWDSVKDLFERDYRLFKSLLNFSLPGKYHIFLCPCPVSSVIWDSRFGMVVDPTRSTAYALYSQEINSADPFLVLQTAALRNFGYTPAFLSEGLANYLSFALLDMKEILKSDQVVPLSQLLDSYQYFSADPHLADRTSATFVKYLVDRYTLQRFKTLWEAADDLNLADKIEEVYNRSLASLESEWKEYVDTITIPPQEFILLAEKAEQMRDYRQMLEHSRAFTEQSATASDSLSSLYLLERAYFFVGDYNRAASVQAALVNLDTSSAKKLLTLAAYKMMNGYYEEARSDLLRAQSLDSTDSIVKFNLALNNLFTGNEEECRKILQNLVSNTALGNGGESRIFLANILRTSQKEADRTMAVTYYNEAVPMYDQQLRLHKASPTAYLWLGIAYLGLGNINVANEHLRTALFLETRPFYLGMINLYLGKVADALGDRAAARDFYGKVLLQPSADYHQKEAQKHLDDPYRQ
jgi:tetratricopeptide (TPR) repeat protein